MGHHCKILIFVGFLESKFTRIHVMKNVTATEVENRYLNLKFCVKFLTYMPEFAVYIFTLNKEANFASTD